MVPDQLPHCTADADEFCIAETCALIAAEDQPLSWIAQHTSPEELCRLYHDETKNYK